MEYSGNEKLVFNVEILVKNNRFGQSTVLSNSDYLKIRKNQDNTKHQLMYDIAWYTGERFGAVIQLKVANCFDSNGKVRDYITFQKNTRKANPDGTQTTRQVPIHSTLKEILNNYSSPPYSIWMFPGDCNYKHIHLRTCDYLLRKAVEKAGLGNKGISTHSFRRSFASRLNALGVDIKTIQILMGYSDIRSLIRYLDIPEEKIKGVIELL